MIEFVVGGVVGVVFGWFVFPQPESAATFYYEASAWVAEKVKKFMKWITPKS